MVLGPLESPMSRGRVAWACVHAHVCAHGLGCDVLLYTKLCLLLICTDTCVPVRLYHSGPEG